MTVVETAVGLRRRTWVAICPVDRLVPDLGVAAIVEGEQVAVFRLSGSDDLYAVGNIDPFSGAAVISRGLVGDRNGEPKVASPIYKQTFSLIGGQCFEDASVSLPVHDVRICDVMVEVRLNGDPR